VITQEAAVNYYLSRFLGVKVKHLFCPECGDVHLDAGYFAIHPHRKHLCHGCGSFFRDSERAVSNPIDLLRSVWAGRMPRQAPKKSRYFLDIKQSDFNGGIEIWASNPALLWTSERNEQEGIHVHVYRKLNGELFREEDETYGFVRIDGIELQPEGMQYLMAQQAVPFLHGKVTSLLCPDCGAPHFDRYGQAFKPHRLHHCHQCGIRFESLGEKRLVVGNPIVDKLQRITNTRQRK
jgi:transposase-like protein